MGMIVPQTAAKNCRKQDWEEGVIRDERPRKTHKRRPVAVSVQRIGDQEKTWERRINYRASCSTCMVRRGGNPLDTETSYWDEGEGPDPSIGKEKRSTGKKAMDWRKGRQGPQGKGGLFRRIRRG